MRVNAAKNCKLLIYGIAILALPLQCLAELGGSLTSIDADQLHMKGALKISAQPNYSVHEIQTPAGTTVREYLATNGVVFGVAWRGRTIPDLRQLLGPYFAEYVESAKTQHVSHGRLSVINPELVVHSSGHMRAFFGRAYVAQLLPPNVTADEIY